MKRNHFLKQWLIMMPMLIIVLGLFLKQDVYAVFKHTGTFKNLTLTFDDTGTLVISGQGAMPNYIYNDQNILANSNMYVTSADSTYHSASEIKKVIIEEGVTDIKSYAFQAYNNLKSIDIPSSLQTIARGAFTGCSRLESIEVNADNENYSSVDGVLFSKDKKVIHFYPRGRQGNEYAIPEGTETIDQYCFWESRLVQDLTLPTTLKTINNSAFCYNNTFMDLTIPDGVTTIGMTAFDNCEALKTISFPASITKMGWNAINDCSALTDIYFQGTESQWNAIDGISGLRLGEGVVIHYKESGGTDPEEEQNPLIVVSLGDSYSSGESIEPFYGQDKELVEKVKDEDWLAHRSEESWPGQIKIPGVPGTMRDYNYKDLELTDNHACKWYFGAVSGAESKHFSKVNQPKPYFKWLPTGGFLSGNPTVPKQCDIFKQINDPKEIDYVILTLGGNDVHFADVIKKCALGSKYLGSNSLDNYLNEIWNNIGETEKNLEAVYRKIRKKAPKAHIIVVGYPQLFGANGSGVSVSKDEATSVNSKVSDFNKKICSIVYRLREDSEFSNDNVPCIHFVDVETSFNDHGAYSLDPWINKIILDPQDEDLNDKSIGSAYSMHPNEKGAKAYAECVNKMIEDIENGTIK